MLQRNGQISNATMLHQMVHSTSTTTRNKGSNKKRTISESSSSESECKFVVKICMIMSEKIDFMICSYFFPMFRSI
jgi:hypothetical protein